MMLAEAFFTLGIIVVACIPVGFPPAEGGDGFEPECDVEGQALPHEPPDLVLLNGKIYTGDPGRPRAEAVAVRGGIITDVGDSKGIASLANEETRRVDLGGRYAYPGFVDAHGHMTGLGRAKRSLDLVRTRSFDEVVALVKERVARAPKGEWILGRGWDQNDWEAKAFPRHDPLSKAAPDHPTWLVRIGGHAGVANWAALDLAGITKQTADPEGGRIVRDPETGEPTGVLVDEAMALVSRRIPPATPAQIREEILEAQAACLRVGLTGVHDAGIDAETVEIYRDLDRRGLLKIRVYGMAMADLPNLERIFGEGPVLPGPEGRFTLRAIKLAVDGALGSRGAALIADYADDPGNRGLLVASREALGRVTRWAVDKGLQVCAHAIGDAANRLILDVYEEVQKGREGPSPRLRVEHAQVVSPADIPRFRSLGVVPSMQPTHCTSDMPWAGDRLGPERIAGAYAWRSILETGARIAAGSDFPVESEDPLWGIYAAITRQDHEGSPEEGWTPDQRLTREEAIRSFTADATYASFEEGLKGTVAPGKWADIVILDKDLLTIPPREILKTRVWATIVGGEMVHGGP